MTTAAPFTPIGPRCAAAPAQVGACTRAGYSILAEGNCSSADNNEMRSLGAEEGRWNREAGVSATGWQWSGGVVAERGAG